MTKIDETFGKRLASFRNHINLSQMEFAKLLEINPVTLSNYERGRRFPDVTILNVLREKTNVNLNWLISGDGTMFEFKSDAISSKKEKSKKIAALSEELKNLLENF